ncbi:hypothetical protein QR98_0042200 [Sarcoptes scabiei]|uniref:Protein SDE2 -like protein n=1 Tax=Sarcoptes scabiei TaxID=52283 RepID=A0A132A455_SARSC|nr:hypothetical protein QR98_0042200 [Sarcoptes scabiei]
MFYTIYKSPFDNRIKVIQHCANTILMDQLIQAIHQKENIPSYLNLGFAILRNGKKIHILDAFDGENVFIQVIFGVIGGKGGFGSMLRAIGAQIEKTTNKGACRDLSGRRLRDVNEEQRIKNWIKKQAEKQDDKKKKDKLRKLAEGVLPKDCEYEDGEFERFRTEIPDIIEESINCGINKQKQGCSRESSSSTTTKESKRKFDQTKDQNAINDDEDNVFAKQSRKNLEEESVTDLKFRATSPVKSEFKKNASDCNKIGPKDHYLWLGIDVDSDDDEEEEDRADNGDRNKMNIN